MSLSLEKKGANYQARMVIRNALFPGSWSCDFGTVPWTTFTEPEVARVGLSEAEASERGMAYDLYTAPFEDNDRPLCDDEPKGFVKVLTRNGRGIPPSPRRTVLSATHICRGGCGRR